MSPIHRLASLIGLTLLGLCCASCTSSHDLCILGYTTAPQYPAHIQTIHVPIFKNETFVRGLEFEVTEAVIKHIEQKAPWKVVQHDGADAILTGKIVALSKRTILHNQLNEVREAELALGVEIDFRDLKAAPLSVDPLEAPGPVPVPVEPQIRERDELVLPGMKRRGRRALRPLNFVESHATFIPELGESHATARQRVVNELATQIVAMLEVPW